MKKFISILWRVLIVLAALVALASLVLSAYWIGKLEGALNPVRDAERVMCVNRDVNIHESPTGYILGKVPAGSTLWFVRLDLPFAYVAYYDGSTWLEGTVTATVLELCDQW